MREIKLQDKTYLFADVKDQGDVFDPYLETIQTHKIKKGKIVDIGAHYGTTALILSDSIPNTGVVCFEAHQGNFAILQENLDLNNLQAELHCYAIGDHNGEAYLRTMEGGSPTYRLQEEATSITVAVRTLDSFNLTGVSFIKVDIEGAELLMLQGGIETIKKNKPVIYLEHHSDLCEKEALYSFIESLDYELIYLNQVGYIHGETNQYLLLPR